LTGYFPDGFPSRLVAVEHQGHPVEVARQLLSLRFGQRASQQGADVLKAGLVHLHRVKEPFDHDHVAPMHRRHPVKIEQLQRFVKPAGKRYFGSCPSMERPA
jgi:hypothetical protein